MSLYVIAHYCNGNLDSPFPPNIKDIAGEGDIAKFQQTQGREGGIIVVAYDTLDMNMLIKEFKHYLKDNYLTFIGIHKPGDKELCYSEVFEAIF